MIQNIFSFLRSFSRHHLLYFKFLLGITLLYGIFFTATDFCNNPFHSLSDFTIIAMQWAVVVFATFGLLYALSVNKYIFLLLFPFLTLISSVLAYYRMTANVIFTPMILDAALGNDVRTSTDLLSWPFVLFVLVFLLASVWLALFRFRKIHVSHVYIHAVISLGVIVVTNVVIEPFKRPISERIPYVLYYTVDKYLTERKEIHTARKTVDSGATNFIDSLTVVLIIGESARPDHFGINGYHRNTTPHLSQQKVVSLPNIYSEYTYTNRSLPHLLTRADSASVDLAFTEESFISIFDKCGFYTSWLANQESAEEYVYFMKESQQLAYANRGKTPYSFEVWVDGEMLPFLAEDLKQKSPKKLIVMHTIGSHWWYNSHFTKEFQKFNPVVRSRVISANTKEEMINSYDNTILYTDYFINEVIEKIKDEKAILIYMSDHGESLGEEGFWLHATERPEVHSTAGLVWASEKYKNAFPEKMEALKENAHKKHRTDVLFHTILDAAAIKSPFLEKELSLFSPRP